MNTISKTQQATGALVFALALITEVASAQSYPPARLLAAKWWQWASAEPIAQNPVLDQTGAFASINQPQGNIWFLAGNQGGTTVRTITIPAGKALFFPVANVADVEAGTAIPGGTKVFSVKNPLQVSQATAAAIISTAYGLSCSVDGTPIPITVANLEASTPFTLHLPEDNFFGVPAGVYYPAADSGYYVLLDPLSPGAHTIHFTGGISFFGSFFVDVTYNITVQ